MELVKLRPMVAMICTVVMHPLTSWAQDTFVRGDAFTDNVINISDPVLIMAYLQQGKSVACLDACDTNNSGTITSADANYLYNYMFYGGPPPPAPFPGCGVDPQPGITLGCSPGHTWCDQEGPPPDGFTTEAVIYIDDFSIPVGGPGTAQIFAADPVVKKTNPIQGFQVFVNSPPELELVEINITGTVPEQKGAELVIAQIIDPHSAGMLLVVMDANEPFDLQTIPLSASPVHIGNFLYSCDEHPVAPEPSVEHGLFLSNSSRIFKDGDTLEVVLLDGVALCLADQCPVSDERPTVVIAGCDSGVENISFPDGCTMMDKIAACTSGNPKPVQVRDCIDDLTNVWKRAGLITQYERTLINNCALQLGK